MDLKKVFENNHAWVSEKLAKDEAYFEEMSKGQSPDILYIGCSDSRVSAESLMGLQPGEVFVHRNIANMVPNADLSVMSVIEYAVVHLKVKHVVVCGHTFCGGVKAAMQPQDLGVLNPWLRNIRDVYRMHQNELDAIADEDDRYNRLIELNVQEQCVNVLKVGEVQKAMEERGLSLHGWVFDIHSGKLNDLNLDFDTIMDGKTDIFQIN